MKRWQDLPKGNDKYHRYLASREWGKKKQAVKRRSGGICERCKRQPSQAVHHLTYQRLYQERLEDLLDICDECHKYEHGHSDIDPALPAQPPKPQVIIKEVVKYVYRPLVSWMTRGQDGPCLCCPVCGHECTHIRAAYTRMGSDPWEAGCYQGTEVNGTTPERRSALVIEVDGECEHSWEIVIQQHKGVNLLGLMNIKTYPDLHPVIDSVLLTQSDWEERDVPYDYSECEDRNSFDDPWQLELEAA